MDHSLEDIVAPADIAQRLEVSKSTVAMWSQRRAENGMPEPIKILAGRPLYSWREISAWARRTKRLQPEKGRVYDSEGFDVTDDYRKKKKTA